MMEQEGRALTKSYWQPLNCNFVMDEQKPGLLLPSKEKLLSCEHGEGR